MPQRKKPFSGKAKKEQLKAKKQSKQNAPQEGFGSRNRRPLLKTSAGDSEDQPQIQKFNYCPPKDGRDRNRYALQFYRETPSELKARKEEACKTIEPVSEKELEIDSNDYFPKDLGFPRRPPWSYELTTEQLEARETKYFNDYVNGILEKYNWKELSFFELNLETWRQLWRVLEMSDIVLHIVDIRYPAHMFPPSLYEYVTETLKKDFILVLNKIDLAPAPLVVAWKKYFEENYPNLHICMFTTLPGYNLVGTQVNRAGLQVRKRKGKFRLAAEGSQQLFEVCKTIVGDNIDISSWQTKIKEEMNLEYENDEDEKVEIGETVQMKAVDTSYFEHEKYKNGILTIGCLGQPNVGKSSLINAIMGKKVVSVSRTPGHTKHFQTIFLTPNVRLCDCPGLVFPSKTPKVIQVLMGSFPIAQLREPFTTIKYLAERMDLPNMLRIEHPENDDTWCAMDICDGWAKKRGFLTAKAARLDSYRAANDLLRMALDGKICLCLRPPKYSNKKDYWASHPEIEKVKWIQAKSDDSTQLADDKDYLSDASDEDNVPGSSGDHKDRSSEESEDEETDSDEEPTNYAHNKFAALADDD
ncbi:guanine nucleotide-binding protein-like 1 isoform X1 [Tribolium castaneum]|uniref:guanine nucleotide-binding protein-like 1 isoform X1 n=1 Tax=Tribolium castaneum TaxID=7070 RepID=UPI0030FEAFFE